MPENRPYPPPPGYGQYPPPPMYLQQDSPTVKGLLFMLIAGILVLIGQFVCGIITIIGLILAFIGFYQIYGDRMAYPEPHPTNMKRALIFYILGITTIILGVVITVAGAFVIASSLMGGTGSLADALNSLLLLIIGAAVIMVIGTILWILGRYNVLQELIGAHNQGILKGSFLLTIIVTFVGIFVVIGLFYSLGGILDKYDKDISEVDQSELQNDLIKFQAEIAIISYVNAGLNLVVEILWILCFYFAYDCQKNNPQLRQGFVPPAMSPYPPPPPPR